MKFVNNWARLLAILAFDMVGPDSQVHGRPVSAPTSVCHIVVDVFFKTWSRFQTVVVESLIGNLHTHHVCLLI